MMDASMFSHRWEKTSTNKQSLARDPKEWVFNPHLETLINDKHIYSDDSNLNIDSFYGVPC